MNEICDQCGKVGKTNEVKLKETRLYFCDECFKIVHVKA